MDPQVLKLVQSVTNKFNPMIAGGFVTSEVNNAMNYVDGVFRSAQNDFPPDLVYLGISRVSPEEEYRCMVKGSVYDISKSTVYAVKAKFEYKGEELRPYYILLPYLEYGGVLTISGSEFVVSPVLIDKAFSVGTDSIFLSVNKTKINFKQVSHVYLENGERTSAFAVVSDMYYGRNSSDLPASQLRPTHKMDILAVHYLLALDGVTGMFRNRFNAETAIGDETVINTDNYPPNEWTICESTKQKPKALRYPNYRGNTIRIAIKNSDLNITTRSVMASVFYVIDWYPDRVSSNYADEAKLWFHLLALTIKPDVHQEFVTLDKLNDHFKSLLTFVDSQVQYMLKQAGVDAIDIFDVLVNIIETYPDRINTPNEELTTMYGKQLVVLRYLMSEIRNNIYSLGFDLQSLQNSGKQFGKKEIESILTKRLKVATILKANGNDEVNSVSNPTDNIIPIMTLPVKLQSSMSNSKKQKKKKKKKSMVKFSSSLALSASIAEVGNLTSDAKDDMTGRSRLNPYCLIEEDGTIKRNDALRPLIDATQRDINRD